MTKFKPGDRVRVGSKCEGVVVSSLDTVRVWLDGVGPALDVAAHNVRLIEAAPESPRIRFWTCTDEGHRRTGCVEWRADGIAYCLEPGCDRNSTQPRPAYGDPLTSVEYDEDGEPEPGTDAVGWSMAFGCRQTFRREGDGFLYFLSVFDETARKNCEHRAVTPEQVLSYAHQLIALVGPTQSTEPSFHGLPEDKSMGTQSEDDPTVMVYPDGSTDAPVDGAAMDARAADRAPCGTPGCPCGQPTDKPPYFGA